ncbi:MAG: hypothetical protein JW957_04215 [Candidatus Omnitrophica bacterium]|nr:hypothetical protein [Candidatus Omnitrophota bacterium]
MLTPKKRVEAAIRGEKADRIPFTIYENKLPQCSVERQLRNEGLCLVNRNYNVITAYSPNVVHESYGYYENGTRYNRDVFKTPFGKLFSVHRPSGITSWCVSRLFKTPEDYKKLLFMAKDEVFKPCYERFLAAEKLVGEDVILRANIGLTPLHRVITHWMGVETFAIEWADRRDEIEKLCDALTEKLRIIFPIVAKSPALHANFGGNETGNVMGRERFQKYVIPLYNEAGEIFKKNGKFLGAHLDGNNKVWADLVADSGLDYIEAFSPSPDSDMTISDAFKVWNKKLLWINFPSSLHLATHEKIKTETRKIIGESLPDKRLIIGITEDIPEERWQGNLLAMSEVINKGSLDF